ncbi:rhodanese-like domain-containing protein 4, chloroplastic [Nymphaea colorata]|nr:rhodanese-like domain-containing protein 4, chloroplastic [Nymphaea colorata]
MDVLTAAGLVPFSIHKPATVSERKIELRKLFSFNPFHPSHKISPLPGSLNPSANLPYLGAAASAFLSSTFGGGFAEALTYEEALEQSVNASTYGQSSDLDVGSIIDSVVSFGSENPLILAGGFAAFAVPVVLSLVLGKPKPWGIESAKSAYAKLGEDGEAQLLDIRRPQDIKEVGSPDIRSLKKRVVSIAYGGDNEAFLTKVSAKFKDPSNTTLFIIDKFDGSSAKVAELVTANGFKAAFAIKDGAEGTRGWINSDLPWVQPRKAFRVDFGNLTDAINDALGEGANLLPTTLGLAAATGLGALAFSEIETVLQLLGSAAIVQFTLNKLLFAKDREVTFRQIDEFLNTKVAPKELVDEIKLLGKAFLPVQVKAVAGATVSSVPEQKPEIAVVNVEEKKEPEAEPSIADMKDNSAPQPEIISVTPKIPRPLSPYPYYPDFKPPTSPSPSQP